MAFRKTIFSLFTVITSAFSSCLNDIFREISSAQLIPDIVLRFILVRDVSEWSTGQSSHTVGWVTTLEVMEVAVELGESFL